MATHEQHENHHNSHHNALVPTVVLAVAFYAFLFAIGDKLALEKIDLYMIPVGVLIFAVTLIALRGLLFTPFLSLIEERENATAGASTEASSLNKKASDTLLAVEARINEARILAMQERNEKLLIAKRQASEAVDKADEQAHEIIREARWESQQNQDELRTQLKSRVDELSRSLVERVSMN